MTATGVPPVDIRYDSRVEAVVIAGWGSHPTAALGRDGAVCFDDGSSTRGFGHFGSADRFVQAVAALNGRVVAQIGWDATLDRIAVPRIVLADTTGIDADRLGDCLARIVGWAADENAALVVAMDAGLIDPVAALALGGGTTLLVDPGIADCVAAIALAAERSAQPGGVFDVAREGDGDRFERLNAEVGRIAEALARLTRGDRDPPASLPIVGDRSLAYGAPPRPVTHDAGDIRRAIRARRLRDQFFGPALFEDPGWDMLLDLYAANLEQRRVSVSSLCIAAAVAPTTALRWIARMTDSGLFERQPDLHDRRRAYLALSRRAHDAMQDYIGAVMRGDLRIA